MLQHNERVLANTRHALVINTDLPLLSPSPLLLSLVSNVASSSVSLSLPHTYACTPISHTHTSPSPLPACLSLSHIVTHVSFSLSLPASLYTGRLNLARGRKCEVVPQEEVTEGKKKEEEEEEDEKIKIK